MVDNIEDIRVEQAAWCEGWRQSSWWQRLLGAERTYYAARGSMRMRWGEWDSSFWGLSFKIGCYETAHLNIALIRGQAFIRLPFLTKALSKGTCSIDNPAYGFSWGWSDGASIHASWGRRYKIIEMPWTREHICTEHLNRQGVWQTAPTYRLGKQVGAEVAKWTAEHPYHYMLDSGEVQSTTATISRRRATYGARWFGAGPVSRWLRSIMPKEVFESIDVSFADEMGSRRGSWKGGTTGCSYNMKPGETPKHTLMRMQRERSFR